MKSLLKVPSHYRHLLSNEIIRRGDMFTVCSNPRRYYAGGSIGKPVGSFPKFQYYRRRHVAINKVNKKDKVGEVRKNPLVRFYYPMKEQPWNADIRTVRLISANQKYIVGLDISDNFRYKKFLKDKIERMELVEFNSQALA